MRAYHSDSEEALVARDLLKDWLGEKFLTESQYQRMEQDTVCVLRRTNIFLRLVLFLFTLIVIGAVVALFFTVGLAGTASTVNGVFLLIIGAVLYASAEFAVSEAHFYRYGIEEALATCSVGFFCAGMYTVLFSSSHSPKSIEFFVPCAGAFLSLWIWHRFGLAYAFLAAMAFAVWLPQSWHPSPVARHVTLAGIYVAGLAVISAVRSRNRFTFLDKDYSFAEASLWMGVYLAVNLRLSSLNAFVPWFGGPRTTFEFAGGFYWATWLLIWCVPPVVLVRGIRQKDRLVIAVGAISALITLVTNKSYLGWHPHSWDPMLLGAFLIGVALFIRRWLARGSGGIRSGFTARRLSGKDKQWINAGSTAMGFVSPPSSTLEPRTEHSFGGGQSGGGGATSDF